MKHISCFLVCLSLSGCFYYSEVPEPIKSPSLDYLQSKEQNQSSFLSSSQEREYQEIQEQWQELSSQKSSKPENFVYDFDSEKLQKFREIATSESLEENLSQKISLEFILAIGYERNPGLKEVYQKWQATTERYSQAFFLQNLLNQYSSFTRSLDLKVDSAHHKSKVAQKTPFPGSLSLMGEIITSETEEGWLMYSVQLRNLINELSKTYLHIIYARELVKIQREHVSIASSLEQTALDKFQAGLTNYGDVLKAQILKARILEDMVTYEQLVQTLQGQILSLLDLPPTVKLGKAVEEPTKKLSFPLEELYRLGQENRQEVQLSKIQAKKIRQIITLAKDKLYPDFTLGLSYFENRTEERVGQGKMGEPFAETTREMPRFSFGQTESYLEEMRLREEALQKKYQNLKQQTVAEIQEISFQLDTAWRQFLLLQNSLIPLAEENLRVVRVSYQAGDKVDFLDLLDAERSLLDFTIMQAKNKRDHGWKLADLKKTIGTFELEKARTRAKEEPEKSNLEPEKRLPLPEEEKIPEPKPLYTCPMHPEVVSDQPGKCPKCGMKLRLPKKKAEVKISEPEEEKIPEPKPLYTCPMHPEVVSDQPGKCPKCGMKLRLPK